MKAQVAVGIAELKARLSAHLRRVRGGQEIVVVDRGHPVAKLLPVDESGPPLSFREATRPFEEFAFSTKKHAKTDGVLALLEDRKSRG